jgi:hypothetical protein
MKNKLIYFERPMQETDLARIIHARFLFATTNQQKNNIFCEPGHMQSLNSSI